MNNNTPERLPAPAGSEPAAVPEKKAKKPAKKKSLAAPLVAIALSVAGWVYGWMNGIITTFKTIYNGIFGTASQLAEDSAYAAGGAVDSDATSMLVIAGAVILVTIIGIVGVISLFKRLAGNTRYAFSKNKD